MCSFIFFNALEEFNFTWWNRAVFPEPHKPRTITASPLNFVLLENTTIEIRISFLQIFSVIFSLQF